MRGFVSGGIWGLVLGGVTVAGASLFGEQPARNDPPAMPQLAVTGGQVQNPSQSGAPIQNTATASGPAVNTPAPAPLTTPQPTQTSTSPQTQTATQPQPLDNPDTITAPVVQDSPDLDVAAETPVLPNPQSIAPQPPTPDQPVDVAGVSVGSGTAAQTDAPDTGAAPVIVAIVDDLAPQALPPSTLPAQVPGVRVNRPSDTTDEPATQAADLDDDTRPALVRFAAEAANPDGQPELSVILVDDGSFEGAIAAVAGVPFPVTVMLNPSAPNATELMQAYRAAGIEVGVLADLPDGATAADVAVFFEAAFMALPETVAVLDASRTGLQGSADVVDQAISAIADGGRGLIAIPRGFNSALRAASDQGVPSGLIFSVLDDDGQDARVIRRFIDQAAFRARQESGVLLLGQIRGETISALIQWGAATRADQVAIVPASKILRGD